MKHSSRAIQLRLAALSLLLASPLAGQEKAPQPAAANDPFVRDGQPAAKAAAKPQNPAVLHALIEYIEVPKNAWLEYTRSHPVAYDASPLRAEVQRWIVEGKARPFEMACVPSVLGNRTAVESIIERRYATDHVMATPQPVPMVMETRNAHFTFEWEAVATAVGSGIEAQFASQIVTYSGDTWKPGLVQTLRSTPAQPRFTTSKVSSNVRQPANQPSLVQVITPRDAQGAPREDWRMLGFLRAALVPVSLPEQPVSSQLYFMEDGRPQRMTQVEWSALQANETAKARVDAIKAQLAANQAYLEPKPLAYEVERLAVNIGDLNHWFAEGQLEQKVPGLRAAAKGWIGAGRGKEIDRVCGSMQSGNRGVWEDVHEVRYPDSYAVEGWAPRVHPPPPSLQPKNLAEFLQYRELLKTPAPVALKNPVVTPESIETRMVGYTIEMEPIISADGRSVQLQIALGNVRYCGSSVVHEREVNGKQEPDMEQPLFATMKTSTNITAGLGHPALVGTHTPADENGQPHPTERILTFITFRN